MAEPKAEAINIVVKDQTGGEVHFKIKKSTKFAKVFQAYCEKKSIEQNTVKFLFDGQRVQAEDTPETHDMEDGDTLDCFIEQVGGC